MKREIDLSKIIEQLFEIDGFFRAYFKQEYHDYKITIDDVKSIIKREIEKVEKK